MSPPEHASPADSGAELGSHGRLALFRDAKDPALPPNHPVNALSSWRKHLILATLTYAGFLSNFAIAILLVAFVPIGTAFKVSPGLIPNTIGYSLLGFAVGPVFWNALARSLGRRPVYLIGSLLFIPCAIWLALSPSYKVFCAARFVTGLLNAWSQTVPPATIADIFAKQLRGSKMSWFGTAVVIAPTIAPVFCGLIVRSHSWRVLFWVILAMGGLQLILFALIVPETLWNEDPSLPELEAVDGGHANSGSESIHKGVHGHIEQGPSHPQQPQTSGYVGVAWYPWKRPGEFAKLLTAPILMLRYLPITLPSIYYGSVFGWSVGMTIVMPQKFEKPPYSFAEVPLGAAFLAFGIGGLLGKWCGGIVGDLTVSHLTKKTGVRRPEHRLWAMVPLLPLLFVGCIVVGVVTDKQLAWIGFLMGGAVYFFAFSASTGLFQTYVLETFITQATDTQAVFIFWKSLWGFVVPFFVYDWGESEGFTKSYGAQGALATGVGALLCFGLIWKGFELRRAQKMPLEQS